MKTIKYQLYKIKNLRDKKSGRLFTTTEKVEESKSLKSIEKKQKTKYKKFETKIICIPKYEVGYNIYRNSSYYGTITRESEHFWWVKKPNKEEEIFFMKSEFDKKFVNESFDGIEEEED